MRMNQEGKLSAYDVVNTYSKKELERIFKEYGESKFASNIAKKIVEYRERKSIESTLELVEIIKIAVPMKFRLQKHPAKQIFQAIRIEVNHELDVIEPAILSSLEMLNVGGRVVVITFHSLEDRLVKKIFKEMTEIDPKLKGMPNIPKDLLPDYQLVVNKILPTKEEMEKNKRARSATLRVIERIKEENMKKKKVKKQLKMTKFERFLYTLAVFLLLVSPISIVFSKATLAKVNFEVEQQKRQIEKQKKTNEGLSMTIDELASLTKIQEVAKQQGLSYNNNNIKTITEDK